MKKIFTIESIAATLVSAAGYGLGMALPQKFGWPMLVCVVCSYALGMALDAAADKILYDPRIQKSPRARTAALIASAVFFLILFTVGMKTLRYSLLSDAASNLVYAVGFPLLGFAVSALRRARKVRRIRERYGSGDSGYQFSKEEKKYIRDLNGVNRELNEIPDPALAVKTANGTFCGIKSGKTLIWLGIPYAMPPLGSLRWKAPRPAAPSGRIFEACFFGASCPQTAVHGNPLNGHRQSEDCLTLNIWTSVNRAEKKPVLVYFHGGDNTYGGAANPIYDGENFVSENPETVVVSFNYRIGLLGALDLSAVPGGEAFPDADQLSLLDQIAALRWIRENIAAFGGDPENVTLIGDSQGASFIALLSICEAAKGLFHNAVLLSPELRPMTHFDEERCAVTARKLCADLGAADAAELVRIPVETLAAYIRDASGIECLPRYGRLLPDDPAEALAAGKAAPVRFMIGMGRDELNVYRSILPRDEADRLIDAMLDEALKLETPERTERIRAFLMEREQTIGAAAAKRQTVEYWYGACCVLAYLDLLRGAGASPYAFYLDTQTQVAELGCGSPLMASMFLGNTEAAEALGSVMNQDLAKVLRPLLVKFMKGEEPALYPNELRGFSAVEWAPFPQLLRVTDESLACCEDFVGEDTALIRRLSSF